MPAVNFVVLGSIEKSGAPVNGRQKYVAGEVIPGSKNVHTLSVAQSDCDKFEKLYAQKQEIETKKISPNFDMQKFGDQTNEKIRKQTKIWSVVGSLVGGGVPFWLCSKIKGAKKYFIGAPLVAGGAIAGATAGAVISMLTAMNSQLKKIPGFKDYIEVQKQLQKLDIKEEKVSIA